MLLFSFLLHAGIQKRKLVKFLLLRAKSKPCKGKSLEIKSLTCLEHEGAVLGCRKVFETLVLFQAWSVP